jgi:hypothetical protein
MTLSLLYPYPRRAKATFELFFIEETCDVVIVRKKSYQHCPFKLILREKIPYEIALFYNDVDGGQGHDCC